MFHWGFIDNRWLAGFLPSTVSKQSLFVSRGSCYFGTQNVGTLLNLAF